MTQHDALDILKTGRNAFITGPAGSGKTYVVNEYIRYLKSHGVPIGVTASTGIAATHMGGVTIHSWSGMGIADSFDEESLTALSEKPQVARRVKDARVLVIDEVSMLHHFRLDNLDMIARHIRKDGRPFGGLQVVLCGDFFQLPPVSKYGEGDTHFIYRSEAWRDGAFTVCYLSENHRQRGDGLLAILNEIRSGDVSDGAREELSQRYCGPARALASSGPASAALHDFGESPADAAPASRPLRAPKAPLEASALAGSHIESPGRFAGSPTRLYTHNINVDAVNEAELAKVDGPEFLYEMRAHGRKPLIESLKKSCLAPEKLRLRKGARVMCVKNNFEKGYVNGTLGVVVSCGPGVDPVIRTAPSPDFPRGRELAIEAATWTIEDDGRVLAELVQYPLRLAWAITVHKSQGMSLDAVEVDLSRCFEPGMGYVALSRVRTMAGLSILGMNEGALRVHPEVLEYDRHLRELSAKAESVIEHTDAGELARAQDEFLAKVAPMHRIGSKEKGGRSRKKGAKDNGGKKGDGTSGRATKESTYIRTDELIRKHKSLREIANAREMTVETVIAHIEKLVELGPDAGGLSLKDIAHLRYEVSQRHWAALEKALAEVADARTKDDSKPPLLSPVKNKVGPNVSFNEIRLARVILGYMKRGGEDVARTTTGISCR